MAKKLEVVAVTNVKHMVGRGTGNTQICNTLASIYVNQTLVAQCTIDGKLTIQQAIDHFKRNRRAWKIYNRDYINLAQSAGKLPKEAVEQPKSMKQPERLPKIESMDGLRKLADTFYAVRKVLMVNKISAKYLDLAWQQIISRVESLPVTDNEDIVRQRSPYYFVLTGGEWWPIFIGEVNENHVFGPLLLYRIDYKDHSSESGPAMLGKWANCTADDNPCFPDEVGFWKHYRECVPDKSISFERWYNDYQREQEALMTPQDEEVDFSPLLETIARQSDENPLPNMECAAQRK